MKPTTAQVRRRVYTKTTSTALTPYGAELCRRASIAVRLLRQGGLDPLLALYWVIGSDEAEAIERMAV